MTAQGRRASGRGVRLAICLTIRLARARSGASAVEFALLVPVMLLILVGMLDFGLNILTRMQLDEALSSSANFAIVSGAEVTSSGGATLAGKLASLVPAAQDVAITINNGQTLSRVSGQSQAGGTASRADKCWCPTGTPLALAWGSERVCGATCPDGSKAGKFVTIAVTQAFTPIFTNYGFLPTGPITRRAVVQVK